MMSDQSSSSFSDGIGSLADDGGLNLPGSISDNDINVKVLGEFSTIQGFWGLWKHLNTLELLPDYSNIRLFRKGILPVWEDPANTCGGKWVLPTVNKEEAVRLWPLLVLMCIGEQFESELDVTGLVLSLASPTSYTPPPVHVHIPTFTPTFQVWTRTGPLSLLSPPPSPVPIPPTPAAFLQKLFIKNQSAIVYQPHLMCVDFITNVAKQKTKKKKSKHGARGGSTDSSHYDDYESDDSYRAPTPSHPPEDYHFVPISPSANLRNSPPPFSPSPVPSPSPSPSASFSPPSFGQSSLIKLDPAPRPLSPYRPNSSPVSHPAHPPPPSPSLHLHNNSTLYVPPQHRHSPPPFHGGHPPRQSPTPYIPPPSPTSHNLPYTVTNSPPPFYPISAPTPPSPSKSQTPPPFFNASQRSVTVRTDAPQSPPRALVKPTRAASPQYFTSLHNTNSHSPQHLSHTHSHSPNHPNNRSNSPHDDYMHPSDTGHGPGGARPPSRGPTPTNTGNPRSPNRSSSTSPSIFNRRVQQTKKDELMKKISHSKHNAQIEAQEMRLNPLLLQLVSFTSHKRANASGTIVPTPTRSSSRSSSPQPTPPTSPKVTSAQLKSSTSSAFAIKKSQEISPPEKVTPEGTFDTSSTVSAFSKKVLDDEIGKLDPVHTEPPMRKELENKIVGSKLKHSLRASQEISFMSLDGPGLLPSIANEKDSTVKPQPLRHAQELVKPPPANAPTNSHTEEEQLDTRDRVDSISSEITPRKEGFGNENGVDDAKYDIPANNDKNNKGRDAEDSDESADEDPEVARHTSGVASITTSPSTSSTNLNSTFTHMSPTIIKDPVQTMYNSKYTSYGREGQVKTRDVNASSIRPKPSSGAPGMFKQWWLLFCILFVLCIARWLV